MPCLGLQSALDIGFPLMIRSGRGCQAPPLLPHGDALRARPSAWRPADLFFQATEWRAIGYPRPTRQRRGLRIKLRDGVAITSIFSP
jgi:hypothetical protein